MLLQLQRKWIDVFHLTLFFILQVGLGNVGRFPHTAYEKGGGALIMPYIIVFLTIRRPCYLNLTKSNQLKAELNFLVKPLRMKFNLTKL